MKKQSGLTLVLFFSLAVGGYGLWRIGGERPDVGQLPDSTVAAEVLVPESSSTSSSSLRYSRTASPRVNPGSARNIQTPDSRPLSMEMGLQSQNAKTISVVRDGETYLWTAYPASRPQIRLQPAVESSKGPTPEWYADSVVLHTREAETEKELLKSLESAGVLGLKNLGSSTLWEAYISPVSVDEYFEIVGRIKSSPQVSEAGHNYIVRAGLLSNDPMLNMQYAVGDIKTSAILVGQQGSTVLRDVNPQANIKADLAWDVKRDCRSVRIGIIDSGGEISHPDLAQNMNASLSRNFVSERFLQMNCTTGAVPATGATTVDPAKFEDQNGHGTHVAGTIAAVGNNAVGVAGVCWRAEVVVLRALNHCGSGDQATILQAINHAATQGIKVLNMSLGGRMLAAERNPNSPSYQVVDTYAKAGGLVVAAAGNDGLDISQSANYMFPASIGHPSVVTVASHNADDAISVFSNFHPDHVHIAAPGEMIVSTYPVNKVSPNLSDLKSAENNPNVNINEKFRAALRLAPAAGYEILSGTSMAAPHIAGILALIWSVDPQRDKDQVKNIMFDSADEVPTMTNKIMKGRRVNLAKAVRAALGYSLVLGDVNGVSSSEVALGGGTSVLVGFSSKPGVSLENGELRLGGTKIGSCSDVDSVCVGRIPSINTAGDASAAQNLSVSAGGKQIPAGMVRAVALAETNGLFKASASGVACRAVVNGRILSVFNSPNQMACRNVCRMLLSGAKSSQGFCEYGDKSEQFQMEACSVGSK